MGTAAEEGQVVDDGDVNEVAGLLDDPGNGFQVTTAIFGDENIWRALSTEEGKTTRTTKTGLTSCETA